MAPDELEEVEVEEVPTVEDAVLSPDSVDVKFAREGDDVVLTMIRDGDHRLSRDQDIARLISAVAEIK